MSLSSKNGKIFSKSTRGSQKKVSAHKHEGKWKNKKQAVAVGLSKARKKGAKVPRKRGEY